MCRHREKAGWDRNHLVYKWEAAGCMEGAGRWPAGWSAESEGESEEGWGGKVGATSRRPGGGGAVGVLSCGSRARLCSKAPVVPQAREQHGVLPNCSPRHGLWPSEGWGGDGWRVPMLRAFLWVARVLVLAQAFGSLTDSQSSFMTWNNHVMTSASPVWVILWNALLLSQGRTGSGGAWSNRKASSSFLLSTTRHPTSKARLRVPHPIFLSMVAFFQKLRCPFTVCQHGTWITN